MNRTHPICPTEQSGIISSLSPRQEFLIKIPNHSFPAVTKRKSFRWENWNGKRKTGCHIDITSRVTSFDDSIIMTLTNANITNSFPSCFGIDSIYYIEICSHLKVDHMTVFYSIKLYFILGNCKILFNL